MSNLKKWKVKQDYGAKTDELAKELGVSRLLARVLMNRGIDTKEKGELFLHPEKFRYCDPYLLPDMDKAAARIIRAVTAKEKIVVYGDYDADGITATSLLLTTLQELGADVDYYIPDRFTEGYGLNLSALEMLADKGTDLVVTVDCGVKSVDDIKAMQGRMEFVVTDHHLPGDYRRAPHSYAGSYRFSHAGGYGLRVGAAQHRLLHAPGRSEMEGERQRCGPESGGSGKDHPEFSAGAVELTG